MRNYNRIDKIIGNFDKMLNTVFGKPAKPVRANPANDILEAELSAEEQTLSASLMRINHTGEVCAQALYQGQALTAQLTEVRQKMERAADEENDHLAWCEQRLIELQSRKSYLNPVWYLSSFTVGAVAGAIGDKWSLGFVAETEEQVVQHLSCHLAQLPEQDRKSRAIVNKMKFEELNHANSAIQAGGVPLPGIIKIAMQISAKIMTMTVRKI